METTLKLSPWPRVLAERPSSKKELVKYETPGFVYFEYHRQETTVVNPVYTSLGLDMGAGHANQALIVGQEISHQLQSDCVTGNILDLLEPYLKTEAERQALSNLDRLNRASIIESLFRLTGPKGLRLISTLSASQIFMEHFPPANYDQVLAAEKILARPFVEYVRANHLKAIFSTHPTAARLAEYCKTLQPDPLDPNLKVISFVPDPIPGGNTISSKVYDLGPYSHTDKSCYLIVRDQRTAETMIARGYRREQIYITREKHALSKEDQKKIDFKRNLLNLMIKHHRPHKNYPLTVFHAQDNFETKDEQQTAVALLETYAEEIKKGNLKLCLLSSSEEAQKLAALARKLGLSQSQIKQFSAVPEDLEKLLYQPPPSIPGLIIIHKQPEVAVNEESYFQICQLEGIKWALITISRPSEVPPLAARHSSASYTTTPFGSGESHMEKVYRHEYRWSQALSDLRSALPNLIKPQGLPEIKRRLLRASHTNDWGDLEGVAKIVKAIVAT